MTTPNYLALCRVEFEYTATTEDELSVQEDQLVWLIENDDQDWHKVKIKTADPTQEPAIGLVPASYLTAATPLRTLAALYDYVPARDPSTGQLENDEEMEIQEGEHLDVMDEPEDEWILVQRVNNGGCGFVPASYVGDATEVQEYEEPEPEPTPVAPAVIAAPAPYVPPPPPVHAAAAPASAGNVQTWSVNEIDKKKKKKKGTLGIGNGAIFFASESDKTPVQQFPLSTLSDINHEKSKHLHLTFPEPTGELHFSISSKDEFNEILAKLEDDRAASNSAAIAPSVASPPPAPAAPPAPPAPAAAAYIPPPPPIRTASSSVLPPPPIRTASSSATPAAAPPSMPARAPSTPGSGRGNAVALYDFESAGDDELSLTEGERVEMLPLDASDDPEWAKVRKVEGPERGSEGVVPASYVELDSDGGAATAAAQSPVNGAAAGLARMSVRNTGATANGYDDNDGGADAEAEAEAHRRDEAALRAQIESDALAARERDLAAREAALRKKEADREERKRQARMSQQPRAAPIAGVPRAPRDGYDQVDEDGPAPKVAPRLRQNGGGAAPPSSSSRREGKERAVRKPEASKVRTWKDRTGQFKVEAEFLGLKDNKIRLHKLNGVIVEVPLEKMSPEDTAYLKKRMARDNEDDEGGSSSRDRRQQSSRSSTPSLPSQQQQQRQQQQASGKPKRRSDFDWFDFFLNAGCDMDNCTRYARNADNEGFDADLIPELEEGNLRSLGLKEGDIIRVRRYIKEKFVAPPPTPDKTDREAQIAADARLAEALQNGTPTPPAPNLFSGPDGALKPRRGRRNTAASGKSVGAVDSSAFAAAGSELAKQQQRAASPVQQRVASPVSSQSEPHKRTSSTIPQTGGFDDDAWDVKPASKSAPAPAAAVSPPPAPTPPPAPPAPPAPAPAAAAPPATQQPARTGSADPSSSTAGLTYNDGLLAQLGIGARPSSTPATSTGLGQQSTGAPYNGPRLPIAPIAANQGLLAPLVPTRTGFPGGGAFGQAPMMPMATGFAGMQPQFTGMPMMSQPTGFAGMTSPMGKQPTGFPFMQPQPTGFMQPQATGFMQPQPTGMSPFGNQHAVQPGLGMGGGGSFNPVPSRFTPSPAGQQQQQQPQQPIQFNPMPPSTNSNSSSNTGGSSKAAQFEPGNIFSSMKDGTFATGSVVKLGPQDSSRYDALRPQPTGMGMGMGGMQPQMTGFPQQQQAMQPQMTGFPGMQQPQMTGFSGQQQQFGGQQQQGFMRQF